MAALGGLMNLACLKDQVFHTDMFVATSFVHYPFKKNLLHSSWKDSVPSTSCSAMLA
jgi:hypothetical protein